MVMMKNKKWILEVTAEEIDGINKLKYTATVDKDKVLDVIDLCASKPDNVLKLQITREVFLKLRRLAIACEMLTNRAFMMELLGCGYDDAFHLCKSLHIDPEKHGES